MQSLRVGWFLALRQIRRGSLWTTLLIICIMTLTFLNLVVVGGVLVGLTAGARLAYNKQYSGDVFIRSLTTKSYIEQSNTILGTLATFPEVVAVSPRYTASGKAESNYKTRVGPGQRPDTVAANVVGIDPEKEQLVTQSGLRLIKGTYLDSNEEGSVVLGKNLVPQYSVSGGQISALVLKDVDVGSKIRITIGESAREYTVQGILSSKIGEASTRIYMSDRELRRLAARDDQNVGEIAVRLRDESEAPRVVAALKELGFDRFARVETSTESQGSFLDDIARTFGLLSNMIGAIGLLVASITIFIVIFINAVTRRKFIGILKGIGIAGSAIEFSYVLQSLFYGVIGSVIGMAIIYGFLEPYIAANPINFPFADGLLLVPLDGTMLRLGILMCVTVIAGYLPARLIVSRNTLDAILGR